jgi:hypothetical protein
VGAALTICGLLNQNGNTRLKVPTGFKKEEQLLKLTIHGIALQLGPQVKT